MINATYNRTISSIPVMASDPRKQQIFNLAHKHYSDICPPPAKTIKIKLTDDYTFDINKYPYPQLKSYEGYYDYKGNSHRDIYVSFANEHLGGGYKGVDWFQEEIITAEFYQMAMGIIGYEKEELSLMNKKEAVLWLGLTRNSQSHPDRYGRLEKGNYFDAADYIKPCADHWGQVNFLSLDAPRRQSREAPYTLFELRHLFDKALCGMVAAKAYGYTTVHTGNWGAGVFNNRQSVILFIQVLAAKLSGIDRLNYWGMKDVNDPLFGDIWLGIVNNWNMEKLYDILTLHIKLYKIINITQRDKDLIPYWWYWRGDNYTWIPYNEKEQKILRNTLPDKSSQIIIQLPTGNYKISYDRKWGWLQINMADEQKVRQLLAPLGMK